MKEIINTDTLQTEGSSLVQTAIRVCMHVRGVVRLDPRVMREATALKDAGYEVHIVDIEYERNRSAEEDIGGIHVKHIRKPDWLSPTRSKLLRLLKSVQKFIASTFWLVLTPADIYHAHDFNALLPCYVASRLRHKLLIFDAHEMPLYDELEWTNRKKVRALMTHLLIIMARRCAGVITVSYPIVQEMYDRFHISNVSLVRNIPPYRVVPSSNRLQENLGLSSNIRIALYQGNLQPDRALDKLVKAAKFLERDNMIILMGKGVGSTPTELEALAERESVTDRIRIIPPVPYEELLDWTASADIGVIVSAPDYSLNVRMFLPNKLFEYLMAGLPVLSSPLPAIIEVISTYDVGCLLSSLEPEDIGMKINGMLSDRTGLERMQRNALDAARSEFYWEKESQILIHLYRDILAKHVERLKGNKTFT